MWHPRQCSEVFDNIRNVDLVLYTTARQPDPVFVIDRIRITMSFLICFRTKRQDLVVPVKFLVELHCHKESKGHKPHDTVIPPMKYIALIEIFVRIVVRLFINNGNICDHLRGERLPDFKEQIIRASDFINSSCSVSLCRRKKPIGTEFSDLSCWSVRRM